MLITLSPVLSHCLILVPFSNDFAADIFFDMLFKCIKVRLKSINQHAEHFVIHFSLSIFCVMYLQWFIYFCKGLTDKSAMYFWR